MDEDEQRLVGIPCPADDQFSDEGGVLDTIATGNRQLKARINTVAFHVKDGADILQRIARENDGKYRFVKQ